MSDGASVQIPCVKLPKVPTDLSVTLPGGAELKAFADFSQGIPDDCTITFNLMLQLAPVLASIACLLKVINVVQALKGVAEGLPTLDFSAVPDLIKAINKATGCFAAVLPVNIIITIKGVLQVIIKFMNCFLYQLMSVIDFQANIDMSIAEGNPALQATLSCAQSNADLAMDHIKAGLGPIQPLLDMLDMLADVADVSLGLPSMDDIAVDGEAETVIKDIKQMITKMEEVVDALPG
jgi:hypothetical protein